MRYHRQHLPASALPFSLVEASDIDLGMSPHSPKRRRMSTDSADGSSPSVVSFGSFSGGEGYSSAASSASTNSKRASMVFPFSTHNSNGTLDQGARAAWIEQHVLASADDAAGRRGRRLATLPEPGDAARARVAHGHEHAVVICVAEPVLGEQRQQRQRGGRGLADGPPLAGDGHPGRGKPVSTYLHPPVTTPEDAAKGSMGQEDGAGNGGAVGTNMHAPMFVESYFQ